jgi:hypothetical protein
MLLKNYPDLAFTKELDEIQNSIESFPHATLLYGIKGIKKGSFAFRIAKLLLKNEDKVDLLVHPDLHLYHPESANSTYTIDQIRDIQEKAVCTPYMASCHVFIIHKADGLTTQASNAFLKTLEEPPKNVYFILVTSSPFKLLPTVLSRLVKIDLKAPSDLIVDEQIKALKFDLGGYRFMIQNAIDQAEDLSLYKPYLDELFGLLNGSMQTDYLAFREFFEKIDQDENFDFFKFQPFFEEMLKDFYLFFHEKNMAKLQWNPKAKLDVSLKTISLLLKNLEQAVASHIKLSFALEQLFFALKLN